jgi:hypothetical protein
VVQFIPFSTAKLWSRSSKELTRIASALLVLRVQAGFMNKIKTNFPLVPLALVKRKIATLEIEAHEPLSSAVQRESLTDKKEPYSVQVPRKPAAGGTIE